jgi:hypothetical protein
MLERQLGSTRRPNRTAHGVMEEGADGVVCGHCCACVTLSTNRALLCVLVTCSGSTLIVPALQQGVLTAALDTRCYTTDFCHEHLYKVNQMPRQFAHLCFLTT